jgi:acetyltransferase
VLETVAAADGIDLSAVYLLDEPDAVDPAALFRRGGPPTVLALGASPERVSVTREELAAAGVPVLPTPERCARAVAAVVGDARLRSRREARAPEVEGSAPALLPPAGWDEHSAKRLVALLGIAVPAGIACASHSEALDALATLGAPVVVKALHPGIAHKSELDAVHLGVGDEGALRRALAAIDRIDGARYLVEETARPGPELILGARRDPAFGPVVVLGAGGTQAESIDDAAVRLAPLDPAEAATMLDDLATAGAFRGGRGAVPVDENELAAAIVAFGDLIAGREDIAELEVNPLRVTERGLVALDALVVAR